MDGGETGNGGDDTDRSSIATESAGDGDANKQTTSESRAVVALVRKG